MTKKQLEKYRAKRKLLKAVARIEQKIMHSYLLESKSDDLSPWQR